MSIFVVIAFVLSFNGLAHGLRRIMIPKVSLANGIQQRSYTMLVVFRETARSIKPIDEWRNGVTKRSYLGTVEVELHGRRLIVEMKNYNGLFKLRGFARKFELDPTYWPACVSSHVDGSVQYSWDGDRPVEQERLSLLYTPELELPLVYAPDAWPDDLWDRM